LRALPCDILPNMPDLAGCDALLHPAALEGLKLFNTRHFFEAHEQLETAWRAEPGPIRELYQGILQAAVAYLHIERGNFDGALKLSARSQEKLSKWPEGCRGVEVAHLRADLDAAIAEIRRLGPENIQQFNPALFKPVAWHEKS
jgi:uncharacterized protein